MARQVTAPAQPEEIIATRTAKHVIVGSGVQFTERDTHPLADDDEDWATPRHRRDLTRSPRPRTPSHIHRSGERTADAERKDCSLRHQGESRPALLPRLEPGLSAAPPTPAAPRPGSGRLRPRTRDARLGRAASVPRRHRLTPASVVHRQRREADPSRDRCARTRSRCWLRFDAQSAHPPAPSAFHVARAPLSVSARCTLTAKRGSKTQGQQERQRKKPAPPLLHAQSVPGSADRRRRRDLARLSAGGHRPRHPCVGLPRQARANGARPAQRHRDCRCNAGCGAGRPSPGGPRRGAGINRRP